MNDAGQFYTNRVLKDSKDSRASKDWKAPAQSHVDWTKAWVSTLINLHALVKQYHTTGLVWNPKGGDAKATKGKLASNSNMAQETDLSNSVTFEFDHEFYDICSKRYQRWSSSPSTTTTSSATSDL